MPSIEAPAYYDRAKFETSGRADDFLRSLDTSFAVAETSTVECPLGHLSLHLITRDQIAEYVSREGDPWMSEERNFSPGWYIVRTDEQGFIFGIGYGEDYVFNEEGARADFAEAEYAYAMWDQII